MLGSIGNFKFGKFNPEYGWSEGMDALRTLHSLVSV